MTNMYKLHKFLVLLDIPKGKIPSDTIEKKKKTSYLEIILCHLSWQSKVVGH